MTALIAGQMDRADGLADVVVGVIGPDGPQALIFEDPQGALRAEPEAFALPAEAIALALAMFDGDGRMDLAVASGADSTGHSSLLILRRRAPTPSLTHSLPADAEPWAMDEMSLPFGLRSLAAGDFIWDPEHRTDLALLAEDGAVYLMERGEKMGGKVEELDNGPIETDRLLDLTLPAGDETELLMAPDERVIGGAAEPEALETENWHLAHRVPSTLWPSAAPGPPVPLLMTARISSLPTDDLLILDPDRERLHILLGGVRRLRQADPSMSLPAPLRPHVAASLNMDGPPVAALPMRLNGDGLSDLVILREGRATPVVSLSAPLAVFTVTNVNNGGGGSLRAAINNANGAAGADLINFNIPGAAPHVINLTSILPTIIDTVMIDASTQPGFAGAPIVGLNGAAVGGATPDGLRMNAANSVVRGLLISNFARVGIFAFTNGANTTVETNYLGTDFAGGAVFADQFGVVLFTANNIVGGGAAAMRNLISGTTALAVLIRGAGATGNRVQGNFIGTDINGSAALGNAGDGVRIDQGASNNTIGGTTTTAGVPPGNLISGNGDDGIDVRNDGTTGNLVQGNLIGTTAAGTAALANDSGVLINGAAGNTVGGTTTSARNLISGNGNSGMIIAGNGASGNQVQGNFIGLNINGTASLGNIGDGVLITDAPNNTIGGASAAARNIISGNTDDGVQMDTAGATGNQVQGNFIGTDVSGATALGNGDDGVFINAASSNAVGGMTTTPGAPPGNLISGNTDEGVSIAGGATSNLVQGNLIGVTAAGAAALANGDHGVFIDAAPSNTIGGASTQARNIISGNTTNGILIANSGATANLIQGNFIGTDINGVADVGNSQDGVIINNGAADNTIGGLTSTPGTPPGNLISGNGAPFDLVHDGIEISGLATTGNLIQGNLIGTNAAGTAALGNGDDGIQFRDAPNNTIGGTTSTARNVLSGNNDQGVNLTLAGTTGALIQGNSIGVDISGTGALGNASNGVRIFRAIDSTIGGSTTSAGNMIANNGHDGVFVDPDDAIATGNSIRRNSIFSNGSAANDLGIDLVPDGATPNDAGDADAGANTLQNFPSMTTAQLAPGNELFITYSVSSTTGNSSYPLTIEFFLAESTTSNQGMTFLGDDAYPAASAQMSVTVNLGNVGVSLGDPIAATATDSNGNTSEFSAIVTVSAPTADPDVSSFQARVSFKGAVITNWETNREIDIRGFNVWRRQDENEPPVRVNERLIAAQAIGSIRGAHYQLTDRSVRRGETYEYALELIRLDGRREHLGPVQITVSGPQSVRDAPVRE